MTNANYERHGMKPIILGNNEKYDNEFKKKRTITLKNGKISKGAKDENASKLQKRT